MYIRNRLLYTQCCVHNIAHTGKQGQLRPPRSVMSMGLPLPFFIHSILSVYGGMTLFALLSVSPLSPSDLAALHDAQMTLFALLSVSPLSPSDLVALHDAQMPRYAAYLQLLQIPTKLATRTVAWRRRLPCRQRFVVHSVTA